MKKTKAIVLILLALFFFSKNMVSFPLADPSKSVCYAIDLEESGSSSEEGEKHPLNGKEKCEDWMISHSFPTLSISVSTHFFKYQAESSFLSPYFEISSPPPEFCAFA